MSDDDVEVRIFIGGKQLVGIGRGFKMQFKEDEKAARQPYDLDLKATEIEAPTPALPTPTKPENTL